MSKLMTILEQMHDEARGAEEYAKCAVHCASSDSELADAYISMAKTEIEHFAKLQRHAVKLCQQLKAAGHDMCEEVYAHCESRDLVHIAEAKTLIDDYR